MVAPLSGKLQQKMQLDRSKALADEQRKQELQEIKVQEAEAKANLGLQFKTRDQIIKEKQKLADSGMHSPVPPLNPVPERRDDIEFSNPEGGPSDTVPAMLTPGEAVIPEAAAQNPKNKEVITSLVNEGRGYAKGTTKVPKKSTGMVDPENMLPTIPIVGSRRKLKGYAGGTESVQDEYNKRQGFMPSNLNEVLAAQIRQESGGNHSAVSPKGARGIAQIMPNTGVDPGYGVSPLANQSQEEALRFQNDYMRAMLTRYGGDTDKALAAYNAGAGNVDSASKAGDAWLSKMPLETQKYVPAIEGYVANMKVSPTTPTDPGLKAPWYSPEYARAASMSDKGGLELERDRRTAAFADGYMNDPVKAFVKQGVIGGIPVPSAPPLQSGTITSLDEFNAWKQKTKPDWVPPKQIDALASVPEVPPVATMTPESAQVNFRMAEIARDNEYAINKAKEKAQVIAAAGKPEEAQSFLSEFLSGIFGKEGIINAKTLGRFALLGAGGLLTGGSVNGSLKYAAMDSLKQYDTKQSVETADARSETNAVRSENRLLLQDYIKDGFDPIKAKRFLETGNREDLGDRIPSLKQVGSTKYVTPTSGSHAGDPFEVRTLTDKYTNETKQQFRINGGQWGDYNELTKFVSAGSDRPVALVDYGQGTNRNALAKDRQQLIDSHAKSAEEVIKMNLPKDSRGNIQNRDTYPASSVIATEMANWMKSHGYDTNDENTNQQMGLLVPTAVEYMKRDNSNGYSPKTILPYLEEARIKMDTKGAIKEDMFIRNDGKPMAVPVRMQLVDQVKSVANLEGKKADDDYINNKLKTLAKAWDDDRGNLSKRYLASKDNSAFYNFAEAQLKGYINSKRK